MRILPLLFCQMVLVALAGLSGFAHGQSGTRPEPPAPGSVIPATAIPGVNSTGPALAPEPARPRGYDPLLDLPPLPSARVTLIGGTVTNLDRVMNQMAFQPFGSKKQMRVHFDTRTRFYRDSAPITERDISQGQRVYLDTMLNGDRVFAKTIWIRSTAEEGSSRGQISQIDLARNTVTVREELSDQAIKLQVSPTTAVRRGDQRASLSDLTVGALVALKFGAQRQVSEITLLATPGSVFTFAGQVTYLDLSRRLIAIANRSDNQNYDVYMDAVAPNVLRQLREGVNVSLSAVFDGTRYAARSVDFQAASSKP